MDGVSSGSDDMDNVSETTTMAIRKQLGKNPDITQAMFNEIEAAYASDFFAPVDITDLEKQCMRLEQMVCFPSPEYEEPMSLTEIENKDNDNSNGFMKGKQAPKDRCKGIEQMVHTTSSSSSTSAWLGPEVSVAQEIMSLDDEIAAPSEACFEQSQP